MAHKIYDPETQEARIFHEADCDLKRLKNKTVAVIGFGSQGHAHALNLKDSGIKVVIGLNKGGRTWPIAEKAGFEVYSVREAAEKADIIMMLTPDEKMADIYKESIAPVLTEGKYLAFAHGFNIHFKQIVPPADVNVFMIAPKGPGHTVRSEYVAGKGTPACCARFDDVPSGIP